MRKPQFASKNSISPTSWWKHARRYGKRIVNKSERSGAKRDTYSQVSLISIYKGL